MGGELALTFFTTPLFSARRCLSAANNPAPPPPPPAFANRVALNLPQIRMKRSEGFGWQVFSHHLLLCPPHDIVIANIVWCMAYRRGCVYCAIVGQYRR